MNEFKRFLKSKSLREAVSTIPYGFIDFAVFIVLILFSLYPLTTFAYMQNIVFMPFISQLSLIHFSSLICVILAAVYIIKLKLDNKRIDIKQIAKEHPYIPLFLIMGILIFISVAANGFARESVFGTAEREEGLFVFLGYIALFILSSMIANEKLIYRFLTVLIVIFSLLNFIYIIDFAIGNGFLTYNARNMGYPHPNHQSYVLSLITPLSAFLALTSQKTSIKILHFVSFILSGIATLINDTLGGLVAVICSLIFFILVYSLCKNKFQLKSILPIVLFIAVIVVCCICSSQIKDNVFSNFSQLIDDSTEFVSGDEFEDEDNHSTGVLRLILWEETLNFVSQKPILGYGGDTMQAELFEAADGACNRTHNEFLQYAFFFGIPAALVYIAAVFTVYLRGLFKRKELSAINICSLCAVAGYLVSAMFGNTVFRTAPLFFIMLGLSVFKNKTNK